MGRIRRSWLPLRGSINQSATKWSSWDKWWTNHPLFGTLIIISPFSPEIIREWCKSNFQKKYQLWQISSVRIHSPVSRNVEQCICTRQDEATSTLPPFPPPPHHRQTWDPAASTLSRLFTGDKISFPWKCTVRKRRLKQKPSFKTSIKSKLSLVFISRQKLSAKRRAQYSKPKWDKCGLK